MADPRRNRGFTLLELMVSLAILAIVTAAIMESMVTAHRTERGREMQTRVQGESRDALRKMEDDVRAAALGAPSGVVFGDTSPPAAAVDPDPVMKRPAVQIYDNVPGGGDVLLVKPGTDAILVVGALRGMPDGIPDAFVAGKTYYDATEPFDVTETGQLPDVGRERFVLVGGASATFARVKALSTANGRGQLTLELASKDAFPDKKADPGTRIRLASAHLYYVDTGDRLVRVSLAAPRPPQTVDEASDLVLLAEGVENLQVDCETEGGLGVLGSCPDVIPASAMERNVEEAKVAGLADDDGAGPRLSAKNIGSLRMVHVVVVARSLSPVLDGPGDDPMAVGNQVALLPFDHSSHPDWRYLRRLYRLAVGVRNTSLGAF